MRSNGRGSNVRDISDFAVIDFEMPDLYARRICAAGICTYEDSKVVDSFYTLIDPQCEFDPMISKITGLTAASVVGAPSFPEAWEQMRPLLDGKVIVAHGASNDLGALARCLKKYRINWCDSVHFNCTFSLAQSVLPPNEKLGLDKLCEKFSIPLVAHHNALSDAHACAELFLRLREMCGAPDSLELKYDMIKVRAESAKERIRRERLEEISVALASLRTEEYAEMQKRQMPNVSPEILLGVPPKAVRRTAAKMTNSAIRQSFLCNLPHKYYEEDLLHAFIINKMRKPQVCEHALGRFLPYITDRSVISMISPASFKKCPPKRLPWLLNALAENDKNTTLFACEFLRREFTDKLYSREQALAVLNMKNGSEDDTDINNAAARYFADLYLSHADEVISLMSTLPTESKVLADTLKRVSAKKNVSDEQKERMRKALSSDGKTEEEKTLQMLTEDKNRLTF